MAAVGLVFGFASRRVAGQAPVSRTTRPHSSVVSDATLLGTRRHRHRERSRARAVHDVNVGLSAAGHHRTKRVVVVVSAQGALIGHGKIHTSGWLSATCHPSG
jgi:hypothetical protein